MLNNVNSLVMSFFKGMHMFLLSQYLKYCISIKKLNMTMASRYLGLGQFFYALIASQIWVIEFQIFVHVASCLFILHQRKIMKFFTWL